MIWDRRILDRGADAKRDLDRLRPAELHLFGRIEGDMAFDELIKRSLDGGKRALSRAFR